MKLLNDVDRCHDIDCPEKTGCERYLQRSTGGEMTPNHATLRHPYGGLCVNIKRVEDKQMRITGGFGTAFDFERNTTRNWYIDREGVKRWADNDQPCEPGRIEPPEICMDGECWP